MLHRRSPFKRRKLGHLRPAGGFYCLEPRHSPFKRRNSGESRFQFCFDDNRFLNGVFVDQIQRLLDCLYVEALLRRMPPNFNAYEDEFMRFAKG